MSREHEIMHAKPAKQLVIQGGQIAIQENSTVPDSSVHSSLQVQQGVIRRALAYDFADLVNFDSSQKYIDHLFRHLSREAPVGYKQTTLGQILAADEAVFGKLAELGVGIRRLPDGTRPLDEALLKVVESYDVAFHMLPMPFHEKPKTLQERPNPYQGSHRFHRDDDKPKGKGKGKKGKTKSRTSHASSSVPEA